MPNKHSIQTSSSNFQFRSTIITIHHQFLVAPGVISYNGLYGEAPPERGTSKRREFTSWIKWNGRKIYPFSLLNVTRKWQEDFLKSGIWNGKGLELAAEHPSPPPHPRPVKKFAKSLAPLLPAGLWPTFRSTFAWDHRIVRSFTLLISHCPLFQIALIESQLDQWCSILFELAVGGNVESWNPFSATASDIPTICTKPWCFPRL